jgi:hypothetical protein
MQFVAFLNCYFRVLIFSTFLIVWWELVRHVTGTTVEVCQLCRLGGVVISVLATGSKVRWFKLGRGEGFLRAIKIRSTPSDGK